MQKTTMIAMILGVCVGCAAPIVPDDGPSDSQVINVTIAAWTDAGLPFGPGCHSDVKTIEVVDAPHDRVARCGAAMPETGDVVGCYIPGIPVLFVSDSAPDRAWTIVHQAMHWLHDCNGWPVDMDYTGRVPLSRGYHGIRVWCGDLDCRIGDALARVESLSL